MDIHTILCVRLTYFVIADLCMPGHWEVTSGLDAARRQPLEQNKSMFSLLLYCG